MSAPQDSWQPSGCHPRAVRHEPNRVSPLVVVVAADSLFCLRPLRHRHQTLPSHRRRSPPHRRRRSHPLSSSARRRPSFRSRHRRDHLGCSCRLRHRRNYRPSFGSRRRPDHRGYSCRLHHRLHHRHRLRHCCHHRLRCHRPCWMESMTGTWRRYWRCWPLNYRPKNRNRRRELPTETGR